MNVTHLSYNVMVGIGFALLALAAWLAWSWWRRRDIPQTPWFLRAVALSGIAAVTALEAGWVATEVGRQPWIVYRVQRVDAAVTGAHVIPFGYAALWVVYIGLGGAVWWLLRRFSRVPLPARVQEASVQEASGQEASGQQGGDDAG